MWELCYIVKLNRFPGIHGYVSRHVYQNSGFVQRCIRFYEVFQMQRGCGGTRSGNWINSRKITIVKKDEKVTHNLSKPRNCQKQKHLLFSTKSPIQGHSPLLLCVRAPFLNSITTGYEPKLSGLSSANWVMVFFGVMVSGISTFVLSFNSYTCQMCQPKAPELVPIDVLDAGKSKV